MENVMLKESKSTILSAVGPSSSVLHQRRWPVRGFAGVMGLRLFLMIVVPRVALVKLGQPWATDGSPLGSTFGWHRLLL